MNEHHDNTEQPRVLHLLPPRKRKPANRKPAPDWVFETPCEPTYMLTMVTEDGAVDEVYMTREEFIALKHALAVRRRYNLDMPANRASEALYRGCELTAPEPKAAERKRKRVN